VYQLVGHWRECKDNSILYKDCPKDKLVDTIERSYMVVKPDDMDEGEFRAFIVSLLKRFKQDGGVFRGSDGKYIILNRDNSSFQIGTKMSMPKIAQAYSQHVQKQKLPFTFEGMEIPSCNSGRMLMTHMGLKYPVDAPPFGDARTWDDLIES